MTSDEIKDRVSVREVLESHGIKVKRNMCSCPFHKDTNPSMAVYPKIVKCFSCGFSGDVFSLTEKLDNVDFKTAFISLGGTYERMTGNDRIRAISKREQRKRDTEREIRKEKDFYRQLCRAITICENANVYEPYSDDWCYLQNQLPILMIVFEQKYMYGNEVNEGNAYRLARTINTRYLCGT